MRKWDRTLRNIERAARQVPCRSCQARPNRYCVSPSGRIRQMVHSVRFTDAGTYGLVDIAPSIDPRMRGFIL